MIYKSIKFIVWISVLNDNFLFQMEKMRLNSSPASTQDPSAAPRPFAFMISIKLFMKSNYFTLNVISCVPLFARLWLWRPDRFPCCPAKPPTVEVSELSLWSGQHRTAVKSWRSANGWCQWDSPNFHLHVQPSKRMKGDLQQLNFIWIWPFITLHFNQKILIFTSDKFQIKLYFYEYVFLFSTDNYTSQPPTP